MKLFISLFIALCSITDCRAEVVKIIPGLGGEVQATRLYSIDYSCDVKSNSLDTVENALDDPTKIKAHLAKGTLSHVVSIYKQTADAAPGATPAPTDAIFNTTVLAQDFVPLLHATPQSVFSECKGQIFVNGSSNFVIQAVVTVNSTNVLADALAKGSTLLKSAVSMGYALFSKSQVPPEFTKNVTDTSQLITDYTAFKSIFDAPSDFKVTKTATLRIGTNKIVTYDADQNVTSSVVLRVNPVVSLVADGHTNFISAYNASATNTPFDLNSFAFEELYKKCEFETQKYYNAGIKDDRDIAYLLYRRMLLASNSHQMIAQCMGPKIARAALIIMKQLPTVAEGYKINDDDLKNILTDTPSKQPHNRPTLAKDVHALLNMLAGDTQTAPDGLREAGLQSFLSMRRIEARRKNAKAFRLRHSQSLARRRQRLSHAMVRSTIQRFGKTTNSLTPSERLTISMSRCGRTFASCFRKFRSFISAVDEQRLQKWKHAEQCRHDESAAIAILDVGRMNDGVEQQAYCVDKNVPLLALDLLARIVPVRVNARPPFSALFTLWLSMMAAVGLAFRCARSRHRS